MAGRQNNAAMAAGTEVTRGRYPNYDQDFDAFHAFLSEHRILQVVSPDTMDETRLLEPVANSDLLVERVPCYYPLFQRIVNREYYDGSSVFLIEVPLSELLEWNATRGSDLAQRAADNTLRYHAIFCSVIDQHLNGLEPTVPIRNRDTIDILHEHRQAAQERARQQQQQQQQQLLNEDGVQGDAAVNANRNVTQDFPPELLRRYELRILPLGRRGTLFPFSNQYIPPKEALSPPTGVSLRHVRAKSMGRLVTITGMVVRATDVKPFCHVATYTCDVCGVEVYQPLNNQREFMPQRFCPAECAQRGKANPSLVLQTRGSKFVKFQELKLQELPNQVPMGHVPRSLSVFCRGELTRQVNPGDVVTVDGVFLPQRVAESGYRAMKAGLMATLYVEAQHLVPHKKSLEESLLDSLGEEESARLDADIQKVATSHDTIGILSRSIAPEIFGHEDIKRALLLQLTGGVCRKLPDGMRIRGDINICLMGDPGVAKSQLLKHVASIAPRGVYTTGKGSSGVGLTAAVTKDTVTGELTLEGGALVLADRGICAIIFSKDEFDKMDEADRTAIHEVMEQQTVSIAKAGIVATLNARAAVLAAANPLYSRYNRRKTLSENINLPNSLLSRFDLMFLILDTPNMEKDIALARHVTFVHQNEGLEEKQDDMEDSDDDGDNDDGERNQDSSSGDYDEQKGIVSPRLLREYISRARRHEPMVPSEVAPYIVEAYVALRLEDRPGRRSNNSKTNDQTVMTARQLLSILRLSQALARLRFSDQVAREDVDEAIRLTHMSKASLKDDPNGGGNTKTKSENVQAEVFAILRDYAKSTNATTLDYKLCEGMVLRKGFTQDQLESCLQEYEALEIIQINAARTEVYFVT